MKFKLKYYYLATGMELGPQEYPEKIVEADSRDHAFYLYHKSNGIDFGTFEEFMLAPKVEREWATSCEEIEEEKRPFKPSLLRKLATWEDIKEQTDKNFKGWRLDHNKGRSAIFRNGSGLALIISNEDNRIKLYNADIDGAIISSERIGLCFDGYLFKDDLKNQMTVILNSIYAHRSYIESNRE